jgi:toxin ParE1/3/4
VTPPPQPPRALLRPRARRDLQDIYDYLVVRNPDAADRFADAVETDLARLAEMPGLGAPRRSTNPALTDLRARPVTGFRNSLIFYLAHPAGIDVIRIYHGARDTDRLLRNE